ncbi:MAG: MBL fold metallo-hydrolase, partial [Thermoplasmata archaeon]
MPLKICVLASGSSGNSTFVTSGSTSLLIDAGIPAREIVSRLEQIGHKITEVEYLVLTHAHIDHYRSVLTLIRRYNKNIKPLAAAETVEALEEKGFICNEETGLADNHGEKSGKRAQIKVVWREVSAEIGNISIETVPLSHGKSWGNAGETLGLLLSCNRSTLSYFTDLGKVDKRVLRCLQESNAVVLEANYHEPIVNRKLNNPAFRHDWDYLKWVKSEDGHLSND